jgi:hypothetical protein
MKPLLSGLIVAILFGSIACAQNVPPPFVPPVLPFPAPPELFPSPPPQGPIYEPASVFPPCYFCENPVDVTEHPLGDSQTYPEMNPDTDPVDPGPTASEDGGGGD